MGMGAVLMVPVIVSILILSISLSVDSAFAVPVDKIITASDAAAGDQFGSTVSISGNTAIVGAA